MLSVNPEPVFAGLAINNNVLGEAPGTYSDVPTTAPQPAPEREPSAGGPASGPQRPKYPLWKLFSRRPLTEAQLASFFAERDGPAFRVLFFAYPDYERFCVDSSPIPERRPRTTGPGSSESVGAPAEDQQQPQPPERGDALTLEGSVARPAWLPPAPIKEKKGVFEKIASFMADVMEEAADVCKFDFFSLFIFRFTIIINL